MGAHRDEHAYDEDKVRLATCGVTAIELTSVPLQIFKNMSGGCSGLRSIVLIVALFTAGPFTSTRRRTPGATV